VPGAGATNTFDGLTIFGAVQEQLRLRLEKKKGPLDVIVVDQLEKVPIENCLGRNRISEISVRRGLGDSRRAGRLRLDRRFDLDCQKCPVGFQKGPVGFQKWRVGF